MSTIAIVDYGMGNIHSVARALQVAAPHATVILASTPDQLAAADRLVLPGQGAMPNCMVSLHQSGLYQSLLDHAHSKPMLGICVGEQMLFSHSDEGDVECLNLFAGNVIRFNGDAFYSPSHPAGLKVPHVGWNRVLQAKPHPLWANIAQNSHFYFVHSYYVQPVTSTLCAGTTQYGYAFTSAVARDNIFAVQFHPEKSAQSGLHLLSNFARWNP
ncbi:imidazole glycerol phosphate synthase subunit HisH [Paenalcaligenes niemegkensis]|uniref:imidazole glycerol phosphate synthase subunit HisH n=1 Tax=Paenalcaligenes niemegkensis TaxID=2895469 RepID=UPI001EE84798|nr:imidazole glycerol phosphate synthase subunit HisH [Paenalcaligenes niemegkensis]MCQ9618125.1 imidazole glycerol phosphate synthase subunit HisH [Paenalcaligenes niemegkensis]